MRKIALAVLLAISPAEAMTCTSYDVDAKIKAYVTSACASLKKDLPKISKKPADQTLMSKSIMYIDGENQTVELVIDLAKTPVEFIEHDKGNGYWGFWLNKVIALGFQVNMFHDAISVAAERKGDERARAIYDLPHYVVFIDSRKPGQSLVFYADEFGQFKGDVTFFDGSDDGVEVGRAHLTNFSPSDLRTKTDLQGRSSITAAGRALQFLGLKP